MSSEKDTTKNPSPLLPKLSSNECTNINTQFYLSLTSQKLEFIVSINFYDKLTTKTYGIQPTRNRCGSLPQYLILIIENLPYTELYCLSSLVHLPKSSCSTAQFFSYQIAQP